jgi:hypothetical protein
MNALPEVRVPAPSNPTGLELVVKEIQETFARECEWLDLAAGIAAPIPIKAESGRSQRTPMIYTGGEDYVSAMPDDGIGNFIWFDVESQKYNRATRQHEVKLAIILWCKLEDVYPDEEGATAHGLARDMSAVLAKAKRTRSVSRFRAYETEAQKVYKGYWTREVEEQYFMRPYAGLRLELDLRYTNKSCCTD